MLEVSDTVKEAQQKERRTRKTHAKVKTGCITCKIRRKKCDETQPHCLRCTSTGRACDGYVHLSPATTTTGSISSSPATDAVRMHCHHNHHAEHHCVERMKSGACRQSVEALSMAICRAPPTVTFSCDTDYHCFDFFRFNTGPQLQSYFDSSMWRNWTVKAALLHPVVLKAATAVGAVHQRFNHDISRTAFEYCAIADRLYREAAKSFVNFREEDTGTANFNEISMVTSMLFALFEGFQGNYDKVVQLATFGLKSLWDRPFVVVHSETRYRNYEMFFDLFQKLRTRATQLFGSPPKCLSFHEPGNPLPLMPTYFDSQEDARDSIFTLVEWIMNAPARFSHAESERQQAQNHHVSYILEWSATYAEMVRSQPDQTTAQQQCSQLLKAVRDATYLLLYLVFFVRLDPHNAPLLPDHAVDLNAQGHSGCPDDLLAGSSILWSLVSGRANLSTNLTRVCMLADSIIDPNSPFAYISHSLSMDSGIGPPRLLDPVPESSAKTRHIVKSHLSKQHSTPRGSDCATKKAVGVYSVAERFASVEEHAVLVAAESLVPKQYNPQWIDVTSFLEERRLLVRYCRPDGSSEQSRGLVWVQEWREF